MSSRTDGRSDLGLAISLVLDRRSLMRGVGGALAATALPLSAIAEGLPRESTPSLERLDDWTIDDVWGAYPRYADSIGHGRTESADAVVLDPVDAGLVT